MAQEEEAVDEMLEDILLFVVSNRISITMKEGMMTPYNCKCECSQDCVENVVPAATYRNSQQKPLAWLGRILPSFLLLFSTAVAALYLCARPSRRKC